MWFGLVHFLGGTATSCWQTPFATKRVLDNYQLPSSWRGFHLEKLTQVKPLVDVDLWRLGGIPRIGGLDWWFNMSAITVVAGLVVAWGNPHIGLRREGGNMV